MAPLCSAVFQEPSKDFRSRNQDLGSLAAIFTSCVTTAIHLTSLCLNLLFWKTGILITPTFYGYVRIK